MPNQRIKAGGRQTAFPLRKVGLLLLGIAGLTGSTAYAATVKISAKAAFKFDKKTQTGSLSYSGKLTSAVKNQPVPPGTQVSIYDAATGLLVHSTQIDPKNAFTYSLPTDTPACNLKIVAGDAVGFLKVAGAPKTCSTVPVCALSATATSVPADEPVSFTGSTLFSGKNQPTLSFDFGNGVTQNNATGIKVKGGLQATASQSFAQANSYTVRFAAKLGNQECRDSIVVSVGSNAAPTGVQINPQDTPANGSAMSGAYAVIPFSDRGDVGTANMAMNQYQQTQSLNAIVYEKAPKKPVPMGIGDATVEYSAASNPDDPVGPGSINTTSQNYFAADGSTGANYNASATGAHARPIAANGTELLSGKNFTDDFEGVKKSGLWDRMLNRTNNGGSDMTRLTSNPATQVTGLDEGARATKDLMANTQAMPGQANPYVANDPQPFKAFDDDFSFFTAQMLPIVGIDDKGRRNPFPLMRVEAKVGGESVAKADGAVVTSTDMSCASCHSKGERSADDNQWFTPVGINDPEAKGGVADNNGTTNDPNGNSGSSYPDGRDATTVKAPAVQNRFELKVVSSDPLTYQMVNPFNPAAANLRTDNQTALYKPFRVWADHVAGTDVNTEGSMPFVSEITQEQMFLRGDRVKDYRIVNNKLQIQLNFKAPENDTPQAKEQAALFNLALLHDYYDSFGNTEPAANASRAFVTQFADAIEDKTATATATPPSCGGHHFGTSLHEVGRGSTYDARFVYSNYSRTMHAFHGRIQVYKEDVQAANSADDQPHSKGDVIRDKRGHHIPFGGAGWDPEKKNNYKTLAPGAYDGTRDDFDPVAFPMHPKGELMLPFDLKRDANGNMVKQTLTANVGKTDMAENCSVCHAGKAEKVYHDMHFSAGLTCESCHGDMQAVGALWLRPGKNFTDHKEHNFRKFEYDQPDCGSCHFGSHPNAGRLAFAAWDKSETSLEPARNTIDQRFAVQPAEVGIKRTVSRTDKLCLGIEASDNPLCVDTLLNSSANGEMSTITASPLFRKSIDTHGNVPCAACHGPAHTIWPVANKNGNANVTAKQLQGYDGTLMECDVCHSKDGNKNSFADGQLASTEAIAYGKRGTLVTPAAPTAYLAGPHGMHPVNDPNWFKEAEGALASAKPKKINGGWHNDMAKKPGPNGEDQCAACHGDDHKGTRLSKTLVDRTFTNENGKEVKVKAGQTIGCGLCHSLAKSFTGAPNPRAKNRGWQKPTTTLLPSAPVAQPHDHGDVNEAANPGGSGGGGGGH